jgi:hypothetical protein
VVNNEKCIDCILIENFNLTKEHFSDAASISIAIDYSVKNIQNILNSSP